MPPNQPMDSNATGVFNPEVATAPVASVALTGFSGFGHVGDGLIECAL